MCGSKPEKLEPSAQDIANVAFSTYRQNIDREFGTPLRVRQLEEARDPELEARETGFFASRANADVAQAGADTFENDVRTASASGRGIQSISGQTNDATLTLASAASEAKNSAKGFSLARADERRLNAQKTGEGLANTTRRSLSNQASSATNASIKKLELQTAADASKAKLLGDVVLSGAKIGHDVYQKNKADFSGVEGNEVYGNGAIPYDQEVINPGNGQLQSFDSLGRPEDFTSLSNPYGTRAYT
jgi:hypothetical protein